MITTIKISDLKSTEDGKPKQTTQTRHSRNIMKTLRRPDAGHKPKNKQERRTKQIYDSIKVRGWNPQRHGHIETYRQGKHTILWSGTHRLAILTHLGHTHTTVQIQQKRYLRRGHW